MPVGMFEMHRFPLRIPKDRSGESQFKRGDQEEEESEQKRGGGGETQKRRHVGCG